MSKDPQPTIQERKFESAKKAARKDRDSEAVTRDKKTARLKAQRLAREAQGSDKPKG